MTTLFPVFLNLCHMDVLLVGGGDVGARKLKALEVCSPHSLTVIDPKPGRAVLDIAAESPGITLTQRSFTPQDVHKKNLVFAATGNKQVNSFVAEVCRSRNILCNIADSPESSSFFVPAHFHQGSLTVALSTHGASPALAARIRKELEEWLGNRYTALAVLMGRLRPLLLHLGLPSEDNARIFRLLVQSDLADILHSGNAEEADQRLRSLLPASLHHHVGDLLHEL